jgi:hypothetical protein
MPICTRAVAKSIPDSEEKPGKGGQQEKDQVGQPRFFPDPTKDIEQDYTCMKHKEKDIQKGIHFFFLYQYSMRQCNMPLRTEPASVYSVSAKLIKQLILDTEGHSE